MAYLARTIAPADASYDIGGLNFSETQLVELIVWSWANDTRKDDTGLRVHRQIAGALGDGHPAVLRAVEIINAEADRKVLSYSITADSLVLR